MTLNSCRLSWLTVTRPPVSSFASSSSGMPVKVTVRRSAPNYPLAVALLLLPPAMPQKGSASKLSTPPVLMYLTSPDAFDEESVNENPKCRSQGTGMLTRWSRSSWSWPTVRW